MTLPEPFESSLLGRIAALDLRFEHVHILRETILVQEFSEYLVCFHSELKDAGFIDRRAGLHALHVVPVVDPFLTYEGANSKVVGIATSR